MCSSARTGPDRIGPRRLRRPLASFLSAALLAAACLGPVVAVAQVASAPADDVARRPLSAVMGVAPATPASSPAADFSQAPPRVRQLYNEALDFLADEQPLFAMQRLHEAARVAEQPYYELALTLAQVEHGQGLVADARASASAAAALRPAAADPRFLLGEIAESAGDVQTALAQFRSATLAASTERDNPRVTAAWFRLGALLERSGMLAAAEAAYSEFDDAVWESHGQHRSAPQVAAILSRHPQGALALRIDLLLRLGRPEEALDIVEAAGERFGDGPEQVRRRVKLLLALGRAEEALRICREAGKQTGGRADHGALLPLALQAARAAGALDGWVDELEQAVRSGQEGEAARAIARHLSEESPALALRLWEALAAAQPDEPATVWAVAVARRRAGRIDAGCAALAAFLRSASAVEAESGAGLRRWFDRQELDPAIKTYLAERAAAARDFADNFVLAGAAAANADEALAARLLGESLAAKPGWPPAEAALALLAVRAYRWEEADAHAQAALTAAPTYALAHGLRGAAAAGRDQRAAMAEAFRQAIALAPRDIEYRAALGHALRGHDLPGAQRFFQEAIEIDPGNPDVLEALIDSYLAENKLDLARIQLERAADHDVPADTLRRAGTAVRFADVANSAEHAAELARQLGQAPADWRTGLRLAEVQLVLVRPQEALDTLERVREVQPDSERLIELRGRALAMLLRFEEATSEIQTLAARYPRRLAVLDALASRLLEDFRVDEAVAVMQRLVDAAEDEATRMNAQRALAVAHLRFRRFDEALRLIDERLAAKESPADWTPLRIATLIEAARGDEAVAAAAAWVAERPVETERRTTYVDAVIRARRYDAGLAAIRQWMQADSEELTALEYFVQVAIAGDRPKEALAVIAKITPRSPQEDYALRLLRSRATAADGNLKAALSEIDQTLSERQVRNQGYLLHEFRDAGIELCIRYKAYDDALRRIDEWEAAAANEAYPTREFFTSLRRQVHFATGRVDEQIAILERMLEASPTHPGVNNDLGYTLVDRGEQVERGIAMIRLALAQSPLNAAYLDSLGWAYYKAGDLSAARKYLERAVRLFDGQDAVLHDHLGDALFRLGEPAAAEAAWRRALERLREAPDASDPPDPEALQAAIAAKLEALTQGATPAVAPLAAP